MRQTDGAWDHPSGRRPVVIASLAVVACVLLLACGSTVEQLGGSTSTSEGGSVGGGTGAVGGVGGQGGSSCAADPGACDDGNPCTDDACNFDDGFCDHSALDGVAAPPAQQTAGDCQLVLCVVGIAEASADDEDLPDDGHQCTLDECHEGQASNTPLASATPCTENGGALCDAMGDCVECNLPSDCLQLPPDDYCQTRTCIDDVCGQMFTTQGAPVPWQQPDDCKLQVCDGLGGTMSQVDDNDLPDDNNDCTDDVCTNGVPTNPSLPADAPCGPNGAYTCGVYGACVPCLNSNVCGTDTFCRWFTCESQGCVINYTMAGTTLPPGMQVAGDCLELQCDGVGNEQNVPNANDLPPDDGNECTAEACANGTPVHPPEPANTPCTQNGGSACDGAGQCV